MSEEVQKQIQEQFMLIARSKRASERMFLYRKDRYTSQFPALHIKTDNGYIYKIIFTYDYNYLRVLDCGRPNYCELKRGEEVKRVRGLWIVNQNFFTLQLTTYRKDRWQKRPLMPWESWANLRFISESPPYTIAYYEKAVRAPTIQLSPMATVFNIEIYDFTPYLYYFTNFLMSENCLNRTVTEDSFYGVHMRFEKQVYVMPDMLAHHFVLVPERTLVRLKQKPTLENPNPPDEEKTIELEEGAYFIP